MIDHEITNYHPADQQALTEFFRIVLAAMGYDFDLNSKDKDLRNISSEYQINGGIFLLARRGGRLVGTIALRQIAEGICELKRFYVLPQEQRKGIGTGLLNQVIDHARAGQWSSLRLDTSFGSPTAIALFKKYGFVEIERYNNDPFAQIFMELKLK